MAKKLKKLKHPRGRPQKTKQIAAAQRTSFQQGILQQAKALHHAGRLSEAEALYRQILLLQPNQADALYFLGMLAYQAGQSELAIELIRKAIHCRPNYAEAYCNLGVILNDKGKQDEAIAYFHQALSLKPNCAEAFWFMGNTLSDQGKLDEAVDCFHQVLTLRPTYVEAYNNLGVILNKQGKLDEAAASLRQAVALKPDFAEANYNLGNILSEQGRLDEAVTNFRQALSIKPDYTEAYYNLGITLRDQGKLDEAVACFRKVLTLIPDCAEAYNNLGGVLNDQSRTDEAMACFRQALVLKPDFAEAYSNLGGILNDQDKTDESIACFLQALALKPDYIEVHYNLGLILSQLGRTDDAASYFRKALILKPDYVQAYKGLSSILRLTATDDATRSMENLYNTDELSDVDHIDLGFALGKAFADLDEYEKSFSFILEANRQKRATFKYAIQKESDFFARIKATFSADFFSSHHGRGNPERTPIFIIGMPRSGTTLVEQILASHPMVFGAGEQTILARLINSYCTRRKAAHYPEGMLALDPEAFRKMGVEYVERIGRYSKEAAYITDKMPDNFLRVGVIKTILPNAKVIHCVRNPMDTCFSIFKHDFTETLGYAYDMNELGRYYKLYDDLMAHWERVLPGFIYSIRYEELIVDQQKQTKDLLDFCDLPWHEACLTFHKTKRKVNTASLLQVRQPIYKDSVDLWKRYEKQLEPLKKAIYG
jgi:tetratricopeptide (TPR) repeat protein